MKYYRILKLNNLIRNDKLKIIAFGTLFFLNKRYLNIFLDPVIACNFRCRMCYFSDPNYKPTKTKFDILQLNLIAENFFKNALKLQIGCGAEPTLFKNNKEIISLAKKFKVPHISFTTNGYLLNYDKLLELVKTGLDEIIISCHGATKKVYENMMPGADFDKFLSLLNDIKNIKNLYPNFKNRINYTVNPDNLNDLNNIFSILEKYPPNVIQIRPIRKLGNTDYNNFDLYSLQNDYNNIILKIENYCKKNNIISILTKNLSSEKIVKKIPDISEYTYCYIFPKNIANKNYNPALLSYRKFQKRNKIYSQVFKDAFITKTKEIITDTKFGNYEVII